MTNRREKNGSSDRLSLGSKITADGDCSHKVRRLLPLGRKAMTNLDSILKAKTSLCRQSSSSQRYGLSSHRVWIWELDQTEDWALKNWCFWTVVLEKTLESLSGSKEIKPANSKGNQLWILIGRIDAEVEVPSWNSGNLMWTANSVEKRVAEVEVAGQHHQLSGCELRQIPGDREGPEAWCAAVHGVAKELDRN